MISSLVSAFFSAMMRMRGLLTFTSEKPRAQRAWVLLLSQKQCSGAFSRCACQSVCASRQPPTWPAMP